MVRVRVLSLFSVVVLSVSCKNSKEPPRQNPIILTDASRQSTSLMDVVARAPLENPVQSDSSITVQDSAIVPLPGEIRVIGAILDLSSWCRMQLVGLSDRACTPARQTEITQCACSPDQSELLGTTAITRPIPPIIRAHLFDSITSATESAKSNLAIRTISGWWVIPNLINRAAPLSDQDTNQGAEVEDFSLRPSGAGETELHLRFREWTEHSNTPREVTHREIICTANHEGTVRCRRL